MNFNNRSDYLQGILNALNGLYYYINDFNSTGILYYEVGDLYNVRIGENTYQCLMLNDEINVTTGIEEIIHTDMPEKSETDYSKADKTDMRINKTYLIVDKQNQKIESVVNNVTKQNDKISQITQTVDEINSKISDIADITTYGESDRAEVELTDVNESEPIAIKVHPTSTNISYLYPRENLYPSDLQYLPNRIIRFTRTYEEDGTTKTENIDYELPDDLLRYSSEVYDEFYLDYDSHTCQVIKRCAYNADGTVRALGTEITTDYEYPTISLGEGNYTITLLGYDFGYIYARLMAKNIYTTQFYTKVETNSQIKQTAEDITISVDKKLTNYSTTNEMNTEIKASANGVINTVKNIYETKDNAQENYTQLQQTAKNISSVVSTKVGENEIISKINQSSEAVTIDANKIKLNGKTINLTGDNIKITSTNFNVDKNGNVTANSLKSNNATITGGSLKLKGGTEANPKITILDSNNRSTSYLAEAKLGLKENSNGNFGFIEANDRVAMFEIAYQYGANIIATVDSSQAYMGFGGTNSSTTITDSEISTPIVHQTSRAEEKKNFEKYDNALETLKNIDIYKYNLKNEEDGTKKHIGFVIGDDFNYSEDVTSVNNDGVDTYSFISMCCKAIQEQQQEIDELKKEIKELKGGK